jgi:hypothetical protein
VDCTRGSRRSGDRERNERSRLAAVLCDGADAALLDTRALVAVNDLGPLGDCWSMSGPSAAGGVLYHRNARELVAIRAAK